MAGDSIHHCRHDNVEFGTRRLEPRKLLQGISLSAAGRCINNRKQLREWFIPVTIELEKEALIASGIQQNDRISAYKSRLDLLHQQFISKIKLTHDPRQDAQELFQWLWMKKPRRYKRQGHYRLNEAIDSQINIESAEVGNCLGLTLLYNCLLKRLNIDAGALYLQHAFEFGPHVLTILETKGSTIHIENIFSDGFDYKGHLNNPLRTIWGDKELVADIYHSRGNEFFEKQELDSALRNYDLALELNPTYEEAHMNKAIVLDKIEIEAK
jgi:tetratricopeptide (TPR) repeat protein